MVKHRAKSKKVVVDDIIIRSIIMKQQKRDAYTMRQVNKIYNTVQNVRNISQIDTNRLNTKITFLQLFTYVQLCIILELMFSFWSGMFNGVIYFITGTYKFIIYLI